MSNTTEPVWKKEFDERVEAFANAINLSKEKTMEVLSSLVGYDEQSLTLLESPEYLPIGDLFTKFADSGLTQISRIRFGIKHLRGSNGSDVNIGDEKSLINALANFGKDKNDLTIEELFDRYDEDHPEIAEIIRKRTHGRPCIAYDRNGKINKEVTLELIAIAKKQPTSNYYSSNGEPYRVLRAGEFPVILVDESPFSRGTALINGYCPESETQWTGIPHEARVLARIYVFDIEKARLSQRELRSICNEIADFNGTNGGAVGNFRKKYPRAAVRYDTLKENNQLPTLKINPNNTNKDSGFASKDSGF